MSKRAPGVLAVLIVFVTSGSLPAPAGASAEEHTTEPELAPPEAPMQIGEPTQPATQRHEYDRRVGLVYDDQAGTVALLTEVFEASYWGELHEPASFTLTPSCSAQESDELSAEWRASPGDPAAGLAGSVTGQAEIHGLPGAITGTGIFNGDMLENSFQSPELVGHDWACLTISSDGETYSSMLSGYPSAGAVPVVTAHRAPPVQLATLTSAAEADRADGFASRGETLSHAWLTNNGWASAEPRVSGRSGSQAVKASRMIFHLSGQRWKVVRSGSSPCTARCSVPAAVLKALAI